MKKKSILSTLLCLCLLISAIPFYSNPQVAAKEDTITATGNNIYYIETYEQLKAHALIAQSDCRYVLNDHIQQVDNKNDQEILIPSGAVFNLDLNGYTLTRSTTGNDSTLFRIASNGVMTIRDTSPSQTGYCSFSEGYSTYNKSVFLNEGGELEIINGYYEILSSVDQGDCSVVRTTSGYTNIYDGTFDSSSSWGGDTISVGHNAYMYDTPLVIIFDGEFYGKYQSIDASAFGNYLEYGEEYPDGALHPAVYVLGGNFYITNGGKNGEDASFAYCNNGWGRVIVAGGTVLAKCLNQRDQMFLDNVSKKYISETIDDYTGSYYVVTPPPVITSDKIDYHYRLINLCRKAEINSYGESVYKMFKDQFDYINDQIDTITVTAEEKNPPGLGLANRTLDHQFINWYICDENSYNGADTKWTHMGNYQNTSYFQPDERPEKGGNYIVRCVVTDKNLNTCEDIIRIAYEPLKTDTVVSYIDVVNVDTPFAGNTPDYDAFCSTKGCNVSDVEWYDVTDGKGVLMTEDEVFKAGRSYRVIVRVDTEDGYVFETDDINANMAEGSINEEKAIAYSSYDNTYLELGFNFAPCEGSMGILGDANEDEKVNVKDATAIQKHVASILTLYDTGLLLADVDGSTSVNIKDATAIQKWVAGIGTGFSIGEPV